MPVRMLQFSRIEIYVGNMHVCLFISSMPLKFTRAGACMDFSITRNGALYDHKSDPDAEVTPTK